MAQVGTVNKYAGTLDALAAIGRNESKIAMEKQAKVDFANGVDAAIQGRTIDQIAKEQPWYNKVFGPSATLRGAESHEAISRINTYFAEEAAFLDTDEGRSMDLNAYRKRQGESLRSMLTGNSRVDTMITNNIVPKLGALVETHTKAHKAYVNEQNVLTLSNRILGEANNVAELAASNGWSHDLTGEAKATLGESLSNPPPGMDAASWRKMLVQSVVVNYKQGSDVMHRAVSEMGMKFSPQEQLTILSAQDSWRSGMEQGLNLSAELAWGKIAAGVDEGLTDPIELQSQLSAFEAQFPGSLKANGSRALFRKAFGNTEAQRQTATDVSLVLQGRIGEIVNTQGNIDQKRAQPAFQAAYKLIEGQYDMTTPEGRASARRDKIAIWSANGSVQDNNLKSRMTYISGTGIQDGRVDPNYVRSFENWMDYADANEVKALDLITGDESQTRAQTIYDLVKSGAAEDVSTAVVMAEQSRLQPADPAYLSSKDFNDQLFAQVEDLAASKWGWFGFQTPQEASENLPQISAWIREDTKRRVMQKFPLEAAAKAAAKAFAKNHDFVNGVPIANEGTPLAVRMGLEAGATASDAVAFHMQGLGFDSGDYRVIGVTGENTLYVSITDPDNPDYAESYEEVSLREIGNNYNLQVVLPPIEGEIANQVLKTARDHVTQRQALKKHKQSLGITTGLDDATLDRELEDRNKALNLQRDIIERAMQNR